MRENIIYQILLPVERGGLEEQKEARMLQANYPNAHLTVLLHIFVLNNRLGVREVQRGIGYLTGERSRISKMYSLLRRVGYIRIMRTKRRGQVAYLTPEGEVYLRKELARRGISLEEAEARIRKGEKVRLAGRTLKEVEQ